MAILQKTFSFRSTAMVVMFPVFTTWIQFHFWSYIKPFSWFLYWPSIYISIYLGDELAGLISIFVAAILAWWFFVPDAHTFIKYNSLSWIALGIFLIINILACHFYNRLKKLKAKSDTESNKSLTQYQLLMNSLSDGVFVAQDYKFVFTNPSLPYLLGYNNEEFKNKPFYEVIAPHALSIWVERFEQRISVGKSPKRNYEIEFIHKNGTYIWFELGATLADYFGKPAVLGIVRDITSRKKREAELLIAKAVFENTQEGIAITNLAGEIIAVNPAFLNITEYSHDEVIGHQLDFLHTENQENFAVKSIKQSLRESGKWQGVVSNRRKNGEIYKEWLAISIIRDENGYPLQYINISVDISTMSHVETEMEYLAQHDVLTDLPNRLLLLSRLNHTISRARRKKEQCAILFLDLDHFKPINDTYGHAAGDDVLKIISQRIKARIRETDTVARLGGDEFVVVMDSFNQDEDLVSFANLLISEIQKPHQLTCGQAVSVGTSIGISIFPKDGNNPETLIENADKALYQVKNNSRGSWQFFRLE